MTLDALIGLYEQSIQGRASHTQPTRKSIIRVFRSSWKHGFDIPVRSITKGQIRLWLTEQESRMKKSSFNEYIRFVRHLFVVALEHKAIADSPADDLKQSVGVGIHRPLARDFIAILNDHYATWREARAELNALPLGSATWKE